MIYYFILSLLGICTNLQANAAIGPITKWFQATMYLTHNQPISVHTRYLLLAIIPLLLLILAISIEYYVFTKISKNTSRKRTLYALTTANLVSGIIGGMPLLIMIIFIVKYNPSLWKSLSAYLDTAFKWTMNPYPKDFINDPIQVISWLVFYLSINLIIEAPIIKAFFRQIPFKRILFITFVANLASNIAFLILVKLATLIWS